MKFVPTKDYNGKYHMVAVSDEVYDALRVLHNEVQALWHREHYARKRVIYSDIEYFRFHLTEDPLEREYLQSEDDAKLYDAIFHCLTPTQRRRILMLLDGDMSMRDISIHEHCAYNSVKESVMSALKKIQNYTADDNA